MTVSSFNDFKAQAQDHNVVRVARTLLADQTTPISIYNRLAAGERSFLLESVDSSSEQNSHSFIGRNPIATLINNDATITVVGELPVSDVVLDSGIFAALKSLTESLSAAPNPELPTLTAGLVGYMSYDAVSELEDIHLPSEAAGSPSAVFSLFGEIIAFDHWSQSATVVATSFIPAGTSDADLEELYNDAIDRIDAVVDSGAEPDSEPLLSPVTTKAAVSDLGEPTSAQYCEMVDKAKSYIKSGEIFQVVLSRRFPIQTSAEPLDVYRVLRQTNPSPYMFYISNPEISIVGCSPEALVKVKDMKVTTRPIAGTRPRGATDEQDQALAEELMADTKELAEHVMLVDLSRNDLGRVVEPGSLSVDEMMELERFSHVMHITSEVSGNLAPDVGSVDVLAATMPAGTVSGAPKVRAMQIISELEQSRRGPYAGVVGYFDFDGNADTAIAIRTMFWTADATYCQAGAGIVADSDPSAEAQECFNKAKVILAAIEPAEKLKSERLAQGNSQ